ncbi:unnamed protein product [Macrosiphum euphorbiae]|uniref:Uncharacterized protein n=1 Tax=Macrosiphum euphorbiae TaxID=13131 RepID=A0AAV0WF42_9HEMI|nr:unnamed protein product [Macrosiphum euphorbiae]
MESTDLYAAPDSPTYYPFNADHQPDVLVILLLNLQPQKYSFNNISDLSSDYNPIILSICDSPLTNSSPRSRTKTNWKQFTLEMARITQIPHISTKTDIDREIEKITTNLQQAIKNCSTTQKNPRTFSSLYDEILLGIRTKRHLRKEWQIRRDPEIKRMYNAQISYVRNLIQDHRKKEWDDFTAKLNFKHKSIYKLNR